MSEVELIEKAALKVGMKSFMNMGAASCVYSEGCNGVSQEHLVAFAREVALRCVVALSTTPKATDEILERTQIIRDLSKDIAGNGATAAGQVLHQSALEIERIILAKGTP